MNNLSSPFATLQFSQNLKRVFKGQPARTIGLYEPNQQIQYQQAEPAAEAESLPERPHVSQLDERELQTQVIRFMHRIVHLFIRSKTADKRDTS